ncbi:MAG TPA: hypothetical protein VFN10_13380 [Thermoanaerobaculia bacterium]|nr:hypothetical protein [Thermoanaerobaculia bacterium]
MSCCGSRSHLSLSMPSVSGKGGTAVTTTTARPTHAVFRYEADAPIVVVGAVTKARYRFAGRDAEVAVDIRDRPSVRQVPRLREMRLV